MHALTHSCARTYARAQVTNPIEPLLMRLVKGFFDDDDLNNKLRALYQVERERDRGSAKVAAMQVPTDTEYASSATD